MVRPLLNEAPRARAKEIMIPNPQSTLAHSADPSPKNERRARRCFVCVEVDRQRPARSRFIHSYPARLSSSSPPAMLSRRLITSARRSYSISATARPFAERINANWEGTATDGGTTKNYIGGEFVGAFLPLYRQACVRKGDGLGVKRAKRLIG